MEATLLRWDLNPGLEAPGLLIAPFLLPVQGQRRWTGFEVPRAEQQKWVSAELQGWP